MSTWKKKPITASVVRSKTLSTSEKKEASEIIANETDNGRTIIRFMVNCMEGRIDGVQPGAQVAAATWLGNYLFGKPVETTLQLSMSKTHDTLPGLSDEQLEEVLRGGLSQRLFGGDRAGGADIDVRLGDASVVDDREHVGVQQVPSEILHTRSAEEGPPAEGDAEVEDGPCVGDEALEPSDGPDGDGTI